MVDMTRRQFLRDTTILGMSTLIPARWGLKEGWNFLHDDTLLSKINPQEIAMLYARIGPSESLDEQDCDRVVQNVMPSIESEAKKQGLSHFRIKRSVITYGVAADQREANDVTDYAVRAYKLMESKIKGIAPLSLEWTIFRNFIDYEFGYDDKAFIGKGLYIIDYNDVFDTEGDQVFTMTHCLSSRGGHFKSDGRAKHAFISASPSALWTVFSKLLPLSTYKVFHGYRKHAGVCSAIKADATFTRGIGEILARELVIAIDVPRGIDILNRDLKSGIQNDPLYETVPSSIRWIQANSLQNAYDLYMDSPAKYMAAINKV
jgi:hypothetical protein